MTIKEAIERIRARFNKWALDDEDLTALQVLGLVDTESEDERIRNEIIAFIEQAIHSGGGTIIPEEKEDKWIAYLEKQKEQKPVQYNTEKELVLHDTFGYEDGRQTGQNEGIKLVLNNPEKYGLQKEHKPAEYEKPLLSKFEQAIYDCAWGKVTCKPEGETQEEYAKRWAEHLLLMVRDWADDYIDSQIELAKRKAYDMGKADAEKLAEWSEEDGDMICEIIDHCIAIPYIGGTLRLSDERKKELKTFVKSLHHQPHWKPSEEQIVALEASYSVLKTYDTWGEDEHLPLLLSLHNDLQKLL